MPAECLKKYRLLAYLSVILVVCVTLTGCINAEKAKAEHIQRGEAYLKESKYHEASLEFRNAIQLDERFAEAHWGLARAYEGLERLNETIEELKLTVKHDPNHLEARVKLGNYYLLYSPPKVNEAGQLAEYVLARNGNHIEANILKATVLSALHRPDGEVLEILNRAISLDPNRIASYLSLARFYMSKQDSTKAEEVLKKAVRTNDASALGHIEYGNFLIATNRANEAEEQYRRAVEVEPKNQEAHKILARFYVSRGQRDKAESSYKALANLDPNNPDGRAVLADFYAATGRLDEAVSIYQESVKQWSDYSRGRYRLGEIALQRGDIQGALKQIEEILKLNPRDVDGLLLRARVSLEKDVPKEAVKDLDEVIRNNPSSRSAWYYLAEARFRIGQIDQARAAAAELERQYPSYFSGKLIGAQISFAAGDTKNALRLGNEMVEMLKNANANGETSPQGLEELRARALSVRGLALLKSGNTQSAREDLTEAQKKAPNSVTSYTNLARLALAEKKADEAVQNYEQALKLDKKNYDAFSGLVSAYAMQNKLDQAHARLDMAINENAGNTNFLASLHYLKATAFSIEQNNYSTENELIAALTQDPNYLPAYSAYALLLGKTNRIDQAIAQYNKVLEKKPNDASTYTLIAMLEESRGNVDTAIESYKKAIQIDENSFIAANNLAWLYAVNEKGNIDEAVKLAQNVVQRYPEEAGYADTLGWVLFKKGAYSSAVQLLQKCVELDTASTIKNGTKPSPAYRYRLGMALVSSGDKNSGRRQIEQSLSMGNFAEAEDARKALSTL